MIAGYLAFLTALTSAGPTPQHTPYACYWVTGRLFYSNGTPSLRIWPRGSRRLLGVLNRTSEAETEDILPAAIESMNPSFERSIWGNFRVCPLTPERAGWMRMVYIADAAKLKAEPFR